MTDRSVADVADARTRVLRMGVATSLLQRAVGALVPLVSVPIALNQLGYDGYGAWAAAVAVTGLFIFSDLGIGTGLMTRVGAIPADDATGLARHYVSSAYAMVGVLTVLALAGLAVVTKGFDLGGLLGASGQPDVEAIFALTMAGFLVNVVVSLVVRVQYAVGQQAASNLWQIGSSLLMLGGMLAAAEYSSGATWFICAAAFAPVVSGAANSLWFYGRSQRGRSLAPSFLLFRWTLATELLRLGAKFVLISILLAAAVALDPWIIANTTQLSEVPNYSIPYRVMSAAGLLSVAISLPLWPMHASAVQNGDVGWIRRTTRRMTLASVSVMTLVASIILVVAEPLVRIWLNGTIPVILSLWTGLALFVIAQSATGPMFMVQNGAELLWPQFISYALLLATVPLKWYVSGNFGYQYIPWITAIAYIVIVVPACAAGYAMTIRSATPVAKGGSGP